MNETDPTATPASPQAPSVAAQIRSAIFEITVSEPERAPRLVLGLVCCLFAVLLLWVVLARLDIVAVAQGRLVPQTYLKIVQPADAGIVRELLVQEGDSVSAGQILARLDSTENAADTTAIQRELATQRLQVRRIDAELQGVRMQALPNDDPAQFAQAVAQQTAHRRQLEDAIAQELAAHERATTELASAVEVLAKLEQTLPSYERSAAAYKELAQQNLVGALQAEEKRREALEKSQDLKSQRETVASFTASRVQSEKRLAQLRSAYESDLHFARVEASGKVTQLEQQLAKLAFRETHLELRAPQAGTIKDLATTTIGAVLQPGAVLLTLVPVAEPLLAEVSIENQDVGFVTAGQRVRLKLATYPFQKYGMISGVVKTVSPDSASRPQGTDSTSGNGTNARGGPVNLTFKAIVRLEEQRLTAHGIDFPLAAGMQLSAEIVEGRRTVLEYLLSPLQRVASEAGMER